MLDAYICWSWNPPRNHRYKLACGSRRALAITDTELKVMAALATMGLRTIRTFSDREVQL
jgi:hypothetical protein